ncbi:hypothetical protein BJX99DRAFT_229935 [Aspergillus californicus]
MVLGQGKPAKKPRKSRWEKPMVSAPLSLVCGMYLLVYYWHSDCIQLFYQTASSRTLVPFSSFHILFSSTYSPYCF